jgi:hypothetical protein
MSSPKTLRHMSRQDERVLASYVFTPEGQSYDAWEFDVLVGAPHDPGPFYPRAARRAALYQNSLKVDAIGWFANTPTAIECKPRGGLSAIGQIHAYRQWYREIFAQEPGGTIVCSSMSRQVQQACFWNDIRVIILPPASDYQVSLAEAYVKPLIQQRSVLPVYVLVKDF